MLSDECEQSPNPGICGTQWQSYIDRIYAAKGDPNLVRLSAVAGDYPSGCGGTALFGSGYWESTQITGGTFLSICSDWTSPMSLQLLANSSISQSRFALEYTATENSITVTVDGIEHTDWTFDSSTNEVVLQSNIPRLEVRLRLNTLSCHLVKSKIIHVILHHINHPPLDQVHKEHTEVLDL